MKIPTFAAVLLGSMPDLSNLLPDHKSDWVHDEARVKKAEARRARKRAKRRADLARGRKRRAQR